MNAAATGAGETRPRRSWLLRLLIIFGILTVIGLVVSTSLFLAMTDWQTLTAEEAAVRLDAALAATGGTEPYLELLPGDEISLRHDLEPPDPAPLGSLHLLAWIPDRSKMISVRVPAWFLRLKSGASFGLDALAADLSEDFGGRRVIRLEDLQRRGPGLLLDLRLDGGRRLLLWSAAKE